MLADEIIVDNFAGGGGASLGIELALGRSVDIAVNHDPEAVAMHRANHPRTLMQYLIDKGLTGFVPRSLRADLEEARAEREAIEGEGG